MNAERLIFALLLSASLFFTIAGLLNGESRVVLALWMGIAVGILGGAVAESYGKR